MRITEKLKAVGAELQQRGPGVALSIDGDQFVITWIAILPKVPELRLTKTVPIDALEDEGNALLEAIRSSPLTVEVSPPEPSWPSPPAQGEPVEPPPGTEEPASQAAADPNAWLSRFGPARADVEKLRSLFSDAAAIHLDPERRNRMFAEALAEQSRALDGLRRWLGSAGG